MSYNSSPMTSTGSSNSSRSTFRPSGDRVFCKCGYELVQTSWTKLNPGRRFMSCPDRNKATKCDFYDFLDPELCEHYKELIRNLMDTNKELQYKLNALHLHCGGLESDLLQKIQLDDKLNALQSLCRGLEADLLQKNQLEINLKGKEFEMRQIQMDLEILSSCGVGHF